MRIRVSGVLDLLGGVREEEILGDSPDLECKDILAALVYVARSLKHLRLSA